MRLPLVWSEYHEEGKNISLKGNRTPGQFVLELQAKLAHIHEMILKVHKKDRNDSPTFKWHSLPRELGNIVMAKIFPVEKGLLKARYDGPYRIEGKLGEYTYKLIHCKTGERIERNHHHIKPCKQVVTEERTTSQQQQPFSLSHSKRTVRPPDRLGFSARGKVLYY